MLMFVRLAIEIWELGMVALKVEVGSGVGEWGKWGRGYGFCGPCVCLGAFLLL
jgi:hypothetical protein